MSGTQRADVVIVGGAAVGSSVAYHLASDPAFAGRVLVVEKDPTYRRSASALSAASIRQQYSSAINVEISLYGIEFLRRIGETLAVDGERPSVDLHEGGYLFLATEAGAPILAANHVVQTAHGADIQLMSPAELTAKWPFFQLDGVAGGAWGRTGEGWFDGYGLMQAFRRKARALGVDYLDAQAVTVRRGSGKVVGVTLADGREIDAAVVVNCAGGGGAALARSVGLDLPIHNRKRAIFTFDCPAVLERFPMLIDHTGAYCRPEGRSYLCGIAPDAANDPDCDLDGDDLTVDHELFEATIWPILAERVPAFERLRAGRAWAGHYDMNLFDHNAFIGPVPDLRGFYLANGFSGHGLQQSPAVGRGLAEHIVHGGYRSLDLTPLGIERWFENRPLVERNIV